MKDLNWIESEIKSEINKFENAKLRNNYGKITEGLHIALNIIREAKK